MELILCIKTPINSLYAAKKFTFQKYVAMQFIFKGQLV